MANKIIETTLNDLLNGELRAHHAYLQAAAWVAERNLDGRYKFLLGHAAEELKHMHRIFSFQNELGAPVIFTELPAPQVTANDIKGLFTIVANTSRASPPRSTPRLTSPGPRRITRRPHSYSGS